VWFTAEHPWHDTRNYFSNSNPSIFKTLIISASFLLFALGFSFCGHPNFSPQNNRILLNVSSWQLDGYFSLKVDLSGEPIWVCFRRKILTPESFILKSHVCWHEFLTQICHERGKFGKSWIRNYSRNSKIRDCLPGRTFKLTNGAIFFYYCYGSTALCWALATFSGSWFYTQ
jgi:hypothetical protein